MTAAADRARSARPALTILATGPLTTVQDLGRPGLADQGVPRSGAADRPALALANRLVGNLEGAPALEVTFGGLVLRAQRRLWLATAGAPAPVTLDGRQVGAGASFTAPAGAVLRIGRPSRGLHTYLALHGGLGVPRILGSASQDTLSGIVPQPIAPGVGLALGDLTDACFPAIDHVPERPWPSHPVLHLDPGPRARWLESTAFALLEHTAFTVAPDSNRVGVRLTGPALTRATTRELPPEGLIPGAVQLPPSGQPIIFLADVPTTGGYPVVAVLRPDSLPILAQLVPGDSIRLSLRRDDTTGYPGRR